MEGGAETRDDFWVLSRSMKLTSCHARLAATLHNVFLFTVETSRNSPKQSEMIRTYSKPWSPFVSRMALLGYICDNLSSL